MSRVAEFPDSLSIGICGLIRFDVLGYTGPYCQRLARGSFDSLAPELLQPVPRCCALTYSRSTALMRLW